MLTSAAATLATPAAGSDRRRGSNTMLFNVKGIRPAMWSTSISIERLEINPRGTLDR